MEAGCEVLSFTVRPQQPDALCPLVMRLKTVDGVRSVTSRERERERGTYELVVKTGKGYGSAVSSVRAVVSKWAKKTRAEVSEEGPRQDTSY